MKKSFTLLELIFVIVVIGILAGVALPRLFTGISDATLSKAKTQIATIRAGISSAYSKNIMSGDSDKCPELEGSDNTKLFENVLVTPIIPNQSDINWTLESNNTTETKYKLRINNEQTTFTYEKNASKNCPFTCNSSDDLCKKLSR
ncbi:type II secretion system protein [Caminibacter mediatlanticus TB-2]|uniref:Type II secretion system protein n=1 Tax=Caminibacter mediatlanticus TB-2 TaxID=391592 RepID=A0ABX5V9N0_9BACT|nr:type II secretion system protein [Caminibacter mediatlanticus]QCT95000.1 type II secretion system protein [Caminibacter mediatlanticus TB-2]